MAITITQQLASGMGTAYAPMIVKATSDDVDIVRMIADVEVDNVFVATVDIDPDPSSVFVFDVQSIIRNEVTGIIPILQSVNATDIQQAATVMRNVRLQLFEVTLSGGVFTTAHVPGGGGVADATSTNSKTESIKVDRRDFPRRDTNLHSQYFVTSATRRIYHTNAPDNKRIGLGESEYLGITKPATASTQMDVRTFDENGVQLFFYEVDFSTADSPEDAYDIPIGTTSLNAFSLLSGVQPIITTDVASYSVRYNAAGTGVDPRRYVIDRKTYLSSTRIHFLSRLGRFESFTFTGNKVRSQAVSEETFRKSFDETFDTADRGETTLHKVSQQMFDLVSGLLTVDEKEWLTELLRSESIFIQEGTEYFPIQIEGGQFSLKDDVNTEFELRFTYRYSFEDNTK